MSGGKDARSERLKAALRANLRRRKEQGRGRTETRDVPEAEQPGPPETDSPGPDSDKSGL
ncbi:hypothetical protein [Methylobacterium mesophilicum]|uniref:hypothetical protein n=1 Tax=Methylobacterium mesophilicum TaxID=39956 RepID=UPI0011C82A6D|nr:MULTISPECIES: hypothetical protein [Methylobacterium]TXN44570.1 hypothetical protein FV233_14250 [Methylobacterium sp. WL7]TXN72172.1 hypothetical protein FV228_10085 [Methylobacterium sp. WL18]GJE20902.1 hypothetical protein JHFBIEKO_1335 [Methylobacterium mesophilicum]